MKSSTIDGNSVEASPPDLTESRPSTTPAVGPRIRQAAERYALFALFAILIVAFALTEPLFLTASNVRVILGGQAVLTIVALAGLMPLICGQFDLSVGAMMGASSIVVASVMSRYDAPLPVAVVAALLGGALVGLLNGWLVAYVKANALIVTLGTTTVLQGVVHWYTAGRPVTSGISPNLIEAARGTVGWIPKSLLWLLPVAVIMYYAAQHTPFGRYLASIGSNPTASRYVGIQVERLILLSFVVSGMVAALAGVLLVAQSGAADPQSALGATLLPALAAVFLGATVFRPGHFNVWGTVFAVYFVAFSVSGFQFWGAASWINQVFNGLVLVGAVAISSTSARRSIIS